MAEFINTVDVLGDDALTDSIIDRSITEYCDDSIQKIAGYAFRSCPKLTTANFPAATSVGSNAFDGCTSLTTANFPVATSVGSSAFDGCTSLTTVNFHVATKVNTYAFRSCPKLTTANFPVATSVGSNAFDGCSALTTANFPAATSVGSNAFDGCTSLTTANFPVATSVGYCAFDGCTSLTTANFPVATSVGGYAFQNCTSLTTANFPVATSVDRYVFSSCSKLATLILRNTTKAATLSGAATFANTPIASGTGYIYVPRDLVDSYKSATNWSTYANQFRALEDWTVDGTTTGELDVANRRMVRFFNSDGTLLGYKVVTVGSAAVYDGTPVCPEDSSWEFKGFLPEPTNVTEDMDCYAQYEEPFSLETASWARISEISASGDAANYMSVGDTKSVALKGTMGTLALNDTYFVYILGFNHNSEVEGTGIQFGGFKSDAGAGGIDICLTDSKYSSSSTDGTKYFNMSHWNYYNYGGWKRCDMRYDILGSTNVAPDGYGAQAESGQVGYDATNTCATNPVEGTLMSCLPADLRAVMKPITKYSDNVGGGTDTETNVSTSIDYLPLLAEFEIFGTRTHANSYEQNHQQQYAYFGAGNSKKKYRHSETGSTAFWWERSPMYNTSGHFCYVYINGNANYYYTYHSFGVAPAFMV